MYSVILRRLTHHKGKSIQDLAFISGAPKHKIRKHLQELEYEGIVECYEKKNKNGRPAHLWRIK